MISTKNSMRGKTRTGPWSMIWLVVVDIYDASCRDGVMMLKTKKNRQRAGGGQLHSGKLVCMKANVRERIKGGFVFIGVIVFVDGVGRGGQLLLLVGLLRR